MFICSVGNIDVCTIDHIRSWLKSQVHNCFPNPQSTWSVGIWSSPLDDAPSLEIRHFCDSGMKCFGEHDLFQQLASFLHRNTAVKLYSSGKTFKSLVKRTFSGLLLRLAMTSLFEEQGVGKLPYFDEIDPLFWSAHLEAEHFRIMHHLTRVLQNGLNLHRREPGATMVWSRYCESAIGKWHGAGSTWYVSAHICQVVMAS